jgi:hypothetical protein
VNTDVLVTKEYKIRPDLIPRAPATVNPLNLGPTRAGRGAAPGDATKGQKGIADQESAKNWLVSNGVQFNGPNASAVYLPGSSRLIVRNTQEQLDLLDTIVEANQTGSSPGVILHLPPAAEPPAEPKWKEDLNRKLERIVIPRLEFKEATVPEAIEFLARKVSDLDFDSPAGERGVNIELDAKAASRQSTAPGALNPQVPRVTVSLTNIPLIEALRYVTSLAGLKFTTSERGITIVDASESSDGMMTKEWRVKEDLLPQTDGIGIAREAAQKWLASQGVQFNAGASAVFYAPVGRQKMSLGSTGGTASSVFLAASGRLVVRNTSEQLDLIDTILATNNLAAPNDDASKLEDSQRIAGLLPMKLDLPKIGRMIVLDGLSAADRVQFRYEDWWTRARHLWLWFVAGGFVCLFVAGGRPWWRTCWVALALTFFPLVAMTSAMPVCNALLAGWLVSVIIQRVAARLVFVPARKEATA